MKTFKDVMRDIKEGETYVCRLTGNSIESITMGDNGLVLIKGYMKNYELISRIDEEVFELLI